MHAKCCNMTSFGYLVSAEIFHCAPGESDVHVLSCYLVVSVIASTLRLPRVQPPNYTVDMPKN